MQLVVLNEDLKSLRETLCKSQSALFAADTGPDGTAHDARRLQALIDQIDVARPLGPDGSHGNRHTPMCGCVDKPA